jgi:hypothetical protein
VDGFEPLTHTPAVEGLNLTDVTARELLTHGERERERKRERGNFE